MSIPSTAADSLCFATANTDRQVDHRNPTRSNEGERHLPPLRCARLTSKLFQMGLVDETGCLKSSLADTPFPAFLPEELEQLNKFLFQDSVNIKARDQSFEINFQLSSLLQSLKSKTPQIEDIVLIGGSLNQFLPPSYLKRCLASLGVQEVDSLLTAEEYAQFGSPASDYDIRIITNKGINDDLPRQLSKCVVSFLTEKIYHTESPTPAQIAHVQANAFLKFNAYDDGKTYYCINSFGSENQKKVDLLHVKSLERDHLFLQDAWGLSLGRHLDQHPGQLSTVHLKPGQYAWQAILDRCTGSIRVREVSSVNSYGFPLLLTHLTKGRTCPESGTIDSMLQQYFKIHESPKPPQTKLAVFYPPESAVDMVCRHLNYCLNNHHNNDPWAAIALTLNALFLFQEKLKEDSLQHIWTRMTPAFKEIVHRKHNLDEQSEIIHAIHQAIASNAIPVPILLAQIQSAVARLGLYDTGLCLSQITLEGSEACSVKLGKAGCPSSLVIKTGSASQALARAGAFLLQSHCSQNHKALDFQMRLNEAFEAVIGRGKPKAREYNGEEPIPAIADMHQLADQLLETQQSRLVLSGYHQLLSSALANPGINIISSLILELPRMMKLCPSTETKKALAKKLEAHLEQSPALRDDQRHWLIASKEISHLADSPHCHDNKILTTLILVLIKSQDPQAETLAKTIWNRYSKALPNDVQKILGAELIDNLWGFPAAALNLMADLHKRTVFNKDELRQRVQRFLEFHTTSEHCSLKIADALSLAEIIQNFVIPGPTRHQSRKQKNAEPIVELIGLGKLIRFLIAQGQMESGKKLLKEAAEASLFINKVDEPEIIWLDICEHYIRSGKNGFDEAIRSWTQANRAALSGSNVARERRHSAALDIYELGVEIGQAPQNTECVEMLQILSGEQIASPLKDRFDANLRKHFEALERDGNYGCIATSLESRLGSALDPKEKVDYQLRMFEQDLRQGRLKPAEALPKFKRWAGELQDSVAITRVETIYSEYLAKLTSQNIEPRNLNSVRQLIIDSKLELLWKNNLHQKLQILLTLLQSSLENNDQQSLHYELFINIFGLISKAQPQPAQAPENTALVKLLLAFLKNSWKPQHKHPPQFKSLASQFLPAALRSLMEGNAHADLLELIKQANFHQMPLKLEPADIREIFSSIHWVLCNTSSTSQLEELNQLATMLKDKGEGETAGQPVLCQVACSLADALLKAGQHGKANPWISYILKSSPEQSSTLNHRPEEYFTRWVQCLTDHGDAHTAMDILSHMIQSPCLCSLVDTKALCATLDLLGRQNPVKTAEAISGHLPQLEAMLGKIEVGSIVAKILPAIITNASQRTLEQIVEFFNHFGVSDLTLWLQLLKRTDNSGNANNKKTVARLFLESPEAIDGLGPKPQECAECWLTALKIFVSLDDPILNSLSQKTNLLMGIFGGHASLQVKTKAYQLLMEYLLSKLKSTDNPNEIFPRIQTWRILIKESQLERRSIINIDKLCIKYLLESRNASLSVSALQILIEGLLSCDKDKSLQKEVANLLELLPQHLPHLAATEEFPKCKEQALLAVKLAMQAFPDSLNPGVVVDCLLLVGAQEDLVSGSIFLLRMISNSPSDRIHNKKNVDKGPLANALKKLLTQFPNVQKMSYRLHVQTILSLPDVQRLLSEGDRCSIWSKIILDHIGEEPEGDYLGFVSDRLNFLSDHLIHITKDANMERQCVLRGLSLVGRILVDHHDSLNFLRMMDEIFKLTASVSYVNDAEPVCKAAEPSLLQIMRHPSSDEEIQPKYRKPISKMSPLQKRSFQKFSSYQELLLSSVLDLKPTKDDEKIFLMDLVYNRLRHLINTGQIDPEDFIVLLDKFAHCPVLHDLEGSNKEFHPFKKHIEQTSHLLYNSEISHHVTTIIERQGVIFKLMLWIDMHSSTQELSGEKYKTYPNALSPNKRAICVKECIERLIGMNTLQSGWRSIHIMRNTQNSILADYPKETTACYQIIFKSLGINLGMATNPRYFLELLKENMIALIQSPNSQSSQIGLDLSCEYFKYICGYYLAFCSIQYHPFDLYEYIQQCLDKDLLAFTPLRSNIDKYMQIIEALLPCTIARVATVSFFHAAHNTTQLIIQTFEQRQDASEKKRVATSLAVWITLLFGTDLPHYVSYGLRLTEQHEHILRHDPETYQNILNQKTRLNARNLI